MKFILLKFPEEVQMFEFTRMEMCDVHNRFSVMLIRRNAKTDHLLHLSSTFFLLFSKINNQLLGFVDVEQQVVLCAPLCKIDFLQT